MASLKLKLTCLFWLVVVTNQILALPINPDEAGNTQETWDPATGEVSNAEAKPVSLKELLEENNFNEKENEEEDNNNEDEDDEHELCPICRDDFLERPPLEIECGHKYHLDCLRQYYSASGQAHECFICFKELRLRDGRRLAVVLDEVVNNKLKIGFMAGYPYIGERWFNRYNRFREPSLYW